MADFCSSHTHCWIDLQNNGCRDQQQSPTINPYLEISTPNTCVLCPGISYFEVFTCPRLPLSFLLLRRLEIESSCGRMDVDVVCIPPFDAAPMESHIKTQVICLMNIRCYQYTCLVSQILSIRFHVAEFDTKHRELFFHDNLPWV